MCLLHLREKCVSLFVSKFSLLKSSPHPEPSINHPHCESVESESLSDDPCKLTMWDSTREEAQMLSQLWLLLQGGNTGKLILSHWRWNYTKFHLCVLFYWIWRVVETSSTNRVSKRAVRQENEKWDTRIQRKARIREPTLLQGEGDKTESKPALLYFQPWMKEQAETAFHLFFLSPTSPPFWFCTWWEMVRNASCCCWLHCLLIVLLQTIQKHKHIINSTSITRAISYPNVLISLLKAFNISCCRSWISTEILLLSHVSCVRLCVTP